MKKNSMKMTMMAVTMIAIMGFGGTAVAYRQGGSGKGCPGYGDKGYGMSNLSEEDQARIGELRKAHMEATQSLRSQRNSKRFALKSELAKESPDLQSALKLQAELSDLNAQLGQKRIEHIIEMKKINPNAGKGLMMGQGYGKRHGKCGGQGNRW